MPHEALDPNDVDTMVSTWNRFGPAIWSDDRTLVFDYLAVLWARDRLERSMLAADPDTALAIRARITVADDRFREHSVDIDPCLATRYQMPDPGWWWLRTPKEVGRSLRPELT